MSTVHRSRLRSPKNAVFHASSSAPPLSSRGFLSHAKATALLRLLGREQDLEVERALVEAG